jgi:glycosyltransferase involved in cell wall biosynthesis
LLHSRFCARPGCAIIRYRSLQCTVDGLTSASIIVPARNERGNIEAAVRRIPRFAEDLEIIFVEGHSKDSTWQEIQRVIAAYPQRDIKAMQQPGKGKADAVFAGFEAARDEVLMILDADLTMPPEQLPKFWQAIASGKGEFINGSRLVYPMEHEAMGFLNLLANKTFSIAFSRLLSQCLTDTLCGTKVLRRADYQRLKDSRASFGNFDPFGDFDLISAPQSWDLRSWRYRSATLAAPMARPRSRASATELMLIRMGPVRVSPN